MTEAIGIAAALFPAAWLTLFDRDPAMIAGGAPCICASSGLSDGSFGLGMALYFASQGAGALKWPLLAGVSRLIIAVGGGYGCCCAGPAISRWSMRRWAPGLAVLGLMIAVAVWSRRVVQGT